jgi:hypothetical protein
MVVTNYPINFPDALILIPQHHKFKPAALHPYRSSYGKSDE